MCGIAGIINFDGKRPLAKAIKGMSDSMINRGPDDSGFLFYDSFGVEICGQDKQQQLSDISYLPSKNIEQFMDVGARLAFAHRRLSIIDLSRSGHQPMCDKDQKHWIVFNGEIYNFKELKEELISLGHAFYSETDTEVALNAYIAWGSDALKRFNGMFSFAILDTIKNKVFVARDRIGIKPFYFYDAGNQFVFGSTIRSIIASGLYSPEIDCKGLWQNFSYNISQRPRTAFKGVSALEPGFFMELHLNSGKRTKQRYWDISVGVQDFSMSKGKAIELLDEALHQAVKYRLNSDVEVGTFMSGGIDSTTIAAIASQYQPNIKAFTLANKNDKHGYNEVDEARATAELHQLKHKVSYVDASVIIDNIEAIVEGYEEPYLGLSANYVVSDMVAKTNVKVVLSGLGGDELFAGYDLYGKVNRWRLLKNIGWASDLIPSGVSMKMDKVKAISRLKTVEQYYAYYHTNFSDDQNKRLFGLEYNGLEAIGDSYKRDEINFTDDVEAISYYNLKSYIGNHQVRSLDQFTMNFSLEGRIPMLDHHLIELAMRIPTKYKLYQGEQKHVLREVAKKYVSSSSINMPKRGFSLPVEYWIDNQLKDLVHESILSLKAANIFENREVDLVMQRKAPYQVWQLVMTALWYQKFIR